MMACPHVNIKCMDSRPRDGYRYRRYVCPDCGHRHSTIEIEHEGFAGPSGSLLIKAIIQMAHLSPEKLAAFYKAAELLGAFKDE